MLTLDTIRRECPEWAHLSDAELAELRTAAYRLAVPIVNHIRRDPETQRRLRKK